MPESGERTVDLTQDEAEWLASAARRVENGGMELS